MRIARAALTLLALASMGCHHQAPVAAPERPVHVWTFPRGTQADDRLCVPDDHGGVACAPAGVVAAFIRGFRYGNN